MYEFLKSVITSHAYTDLTAMTAKVDKAWAFGAISDDERTELLAMLRAEEPRYDIDVQGEIAKLWAAVKELQARPYPEPTPEPEPEDIPDWVQPTGAHDAYKTGDNVRYNGHIYQSTIDGNVWAPDV
ncbi:MAG: hypothetical protein E7317_06720 [Clostridiales bacterium]|nr:hypothetical protein [Clostridiales bacterium]